MMAAVTAHLRGFRGVGARRRSTRVGDRTRGRAPPGPRPSRGARVGSGSVRRRAGRGGARWRPPGRRRRGRRRRRRRARRRPRCRAAGTDLAPSRNEPADQAAEAVADRDDRTPPTDRGTVRSRRLCQIRSWPRAKYSSTTAAPAASPPMNPPPTALWPRNSSHSDARTMAGASAPVAVRRIGLSIMPRRPSWVDVGSSASSCPVAGGGGRAAQRDEPHERDDGRRGDGEHRDLAQGVQRPEVDQDGVDDVGAAGQSLALGQEAFADLRQRRAGR